MLKDNPLIKKLKKNQECPDGFYKIALFCISDGSDYHFYRQDNNGLWSHKFGWKIATNKDGKTCKPSLQCDAVLNKYGDPFKKGIVKSTFEREMDAETVVVFIKNGYVFKVEDELENLLKMWKNTKSIVETEHIKIMNSNQCDDLQKS